MEVVQREFEEVLPSNTSYKQVVERLVQHVEVKPYGGVAVHVLTPKNFNPATAGSVLIYVHGGAYVLCSARSTYIDCAVLANATGLRVYSIDYRLAPQHPFPAGLDDCVTAYRDHCEDG